MVMKRCRRIACNIEVNLYIVQLIVLLRSEDEDVGQSLHMSESGYYNEDHSIKDLARMVRQFTSKERRECCLIEYSPCS